jgi:hypothetical protein
MNFDFPTVPAVPTVTIKTNQPGEARALVKQIEFELETMFVQTKAPCKFYLLQFTESAVKIEAFNDESFFCCSTDLLCEAYYDPTGKVIFSYLKTDRVKLSNHFLNLRK